MSKSDKNFKIKSLKGDFNLKNRIVIPQNEEDNLQIKKSKQYSNLINKDIKNHLFPQSNKIINETKNKSLKQKKNVSSNSKKKKLNKSHIAFPAIESYFH